MAIFQPVFQLKRAKRSPTKRRLSEIISAQLLETVDSRGVCCVCLQLMERLRDGSDFCAVIWLKSFGSSRQNTKWKMFLSWMMFFYSNKIRKMISNKIEIHKVDVSWFYLPRRCRRVESECGTRLACRLHRIKWKCWLYTPHNYIITWCVWLRDASK